MNGKKKGGRGETMMSTFEYKSSHDKMFIEGFRMAELYYEEAKIAESNEGVDNGRSDEGNEGGF